MIGWRMLILLLAALGLGLGAVWSLLSYEGDEGSSGSGQKTQSDDSHEEIGEDSRRALRDLLREVDSGSED